jgi:ribonuclease P protein component
VGPGRAFPPAKEGPETADRHIAVEARGFLTGSERLARANRLARASDIRRCLTDGRRHRAAHLEIIWTENATGHPRMGLIVPRFQSSAVARNRLRRRLKEIWRREIQARQPAWDVLVRARPAAYQADFGLLKDELLAWRDSVCPVG